jgi:hypothetical protein
MGHYPHHQDLSRTVEQWARQWHIGVPAMQQAN